MQCRANRLIWQESLPETLSAHLNSGKAIPENGSGWLLSNQERDDVEAFLLAGDRLDEAVQARTLGLKNAPAQLFPMRHRAVILNSFVPT